MIDFTVVKASLHGWITSILPLNMPVIFYHPNAPRPKHPYVTLYISTVVSVGQDWSANTAHDDGTVDMKGDRQFTLQIQAYGGDPLTLLENVRTSLQKQSVLDILRANGIAFYEALSIEDLTDLVDSEFEKRAQLEVLMGMGQIYIDDPQYFNIVEAEGEYFDAVGVGFPGNPIIIDIISP
jgi:hypothetical protein